MNKNFMGAVKIFREMRLVGCTSVPTSVTNIVIPNGVTTIGEDAFFGCSNLTSVEIPNSVTSIEDGAFGRCYGLTVSVPNSVTTIGRNAFEGVKGIEYNGSAVIKNLFEEVEE